MFWCCLFVFSEMYLWVTLKVRVYLCYCHATDLPMDWFGQHEALCYCSYTITKASYISPGSGICTLNCGYVCVDTVKDAACPREVFQDYTAWWHGDHLHIRHLDF